MDLRTTGMEFASEMVIKATLMKMNVVEAPTTLSPDGRSRPPHLRPYRDGWRHLRFMALFSPNWLFLYPGLSLIALGLALGGVLLAHPVYVGGVRFSVDTLIYCVTMIEVGFQAVLFALLSRTYAIQEGLFPTPLQASLFDRWFSLERGVVFGAGLLLVGALLLYKALAYGQPRNSGRSMSSIDAGCHQLFTLIIAWFRDHPIQLFVEHVEAQCQDDAGAFVARRG